MCFCLKAVPLSSDGNHYSTAALSFEGEAFCTCCSESFISNCVVCGLGTRCKEGGQCVWMVRATSSDMEPLQTWIMDDAGHQNIFSPFLSDPLRQRFHVKPGLRHHIQASDTGREWMEPRCTNMETFIILSSYLPPSLSKSLCWLKWRTSSGNSGCDDLNRTELNIRFYKNESNCIKVILW